MRIHIIVGLLLISVSSAFAQDIIDDIAGAIRTGNPRNISSYFIENVDLKVIDQEDVYSKQQAEMILKNFFTKHPVKGFSIAHKSVEKNGSQYIIGTLDTANGKFRTYFLVKTAGGKTLIQQFKIENENE
jgi:hypothetical protein